MHIAVIGAGPSGLATARALERAGIAWTGYEAASDVGGLWDITNPRSTVYESAHLISSRTTTEFAELPMDETVDYPGHRALRRYFGRYADAFGLRDRYRFGTRVTRLEPHGSGSARWRVADDRGGDEVYDGVVIASGTLAEPVENRIPGSFGGELLHSSRYKTAEIFDGERVLVVGGGNSGCDIAADAVGRAASVDLAVRRGAWFIPRYILGRPADTLNQGRPLPAPIKQAIDSRVLTALVGDPTRFGFPKPDHRIYESHPVVNSHVLQLAGQGDLRVRPGVARFDGSGVRFDDGSSDDYDLVLLATGYRLDYPFVDRTHLAWRGAAPHLFLNIFPPSFNGLFVVGMLEASGIGWQGRAEQAELVASYLSAAPEAAAAFRARAAGRWPDLTGGYRYLGLDRMAYYVNKHAYRTEVRRSIRGLA